MKLQLNGYQDEFLFSERRYPALIAGIGTGKTFMLLLKVWNHCEKNPGRKALIIRKEFTDLRDSTISDFQKYFSVIIDSNKNFQFPNGSQIMFRHGSELDVLKNMNLSMVGIEQAEEFENEDTFNFLRDRIRRIEGSQICLIANARGHNWIWRLWINNPPRDAYHGVTANTFDNAHNLPPDFIEDLRSMEKEAPNHYKQYILNSFEDLDEDDNLFSFETIQTAIGAEFVKYGGFGQVVSGIDIARYGNDKSVAYFLRQLTTLGWEVAHIDRWHKKGGDETIGRILSLCSEWRPTVSAIDCDGIGGMAFDVVEEKNPDVIQFNNSQLTKDNNTHGKQFANVRTKYYYKMNDMMQKGHLRIPDDPVLVEQLQSIKFEYSSDRTIRIVPKEKMRAKGFKSPDDADALMMAVYAIDQVHRVGREIEFAGTGTHGNQSYY